MKMVSTDKISNHPDNPRKNLGDLSELTDSIKAHGILQNLTIVPVTNHPGYTASADDAEDGIEYYAVIGNRRLGAAKLAGLGEVPCVVSGMDYQEQIRTMLTENIQRSDLTPYEQAAGFQMMLDLGETAETISQKTGFSSSTVRSRLKLLELDQEKFVQASQRGATLFDYPSSPAMIITASPTFSILPRIHGIYLRVKGVLLNRGLRNCSANM